MNVRELLEHLSKEDPETEVCVESGSGCLASGVLVLRAQERWGKVLVLVDANCGELPNGWEIVAGEIDHPERQPWERVVC